MRGKKPENFMITRAKISAVRASGVRRLLTFLSQMRRLIKGGAYSSKYGTKNRSVCKNAVTYTDN